MENILDKVKDKIFSEMQNVGIGTNIHYPTILPHLPSFEKFNHSLGDFPNAEKLAAKELSLPCYPGMPEDFIEIVVDELHASTMSIR